MPPKPDDEPIAPENDDGSKILRSLHEHNTMLSGIVHVGRVILEGGPEMPLDVPRVLVHIGGTEKDTFVRNWLPWVTVRAGYDGEWWQPEPNEQVLIVSPSGNISQGYIVGSLYRNCLTFDPEAGDIKARDPVPGAEEGAAETDKQVHYRVYQDGTSISYDRTYHKLMVELKSAATEKEKSLLFSATMDPEGQKAGTGSLALQVGDKSALDFAMDINNSTGDGGELHVASTLKTTFITGTVDAPKVTLLSDAAEESLLLSVGDGTTNATIKNEGTITLTSAGTSIAIEKDSKITLTAGATVITVNQDGAVDINAGSNDITISGKVKVTGTLDVS